MTDITNAKTIPLEASDGNCYKITDFDQTKRLLLYFYPKDNTPGCSIEAEDFTCLKEQFKKHGIQIVGVSPDSLQSHEKFITKKNIDFLLLSDPEKKLSTALGVFGEKKNYGITYTGIIRSTFLIDIKKQEIIQEWKNVKALGHARRVLKWVEENNR